MRYKDVLVHLRRFHKVDDEGMPTFKARLYILRKAGIPPVEKVGTGARVTYSIDDLAELHLALTMTEFGLSPTRISKIMSYIRITTPWWPFTKYTDEWLYIAIRVSNGKLSDMETDEFIQSIGIGRESLMIENLRRFSKVIPTWHAVLSLREIAANLRSAESGININSDA
jgi:hypothetical protein